ncbi:MULTISPECIES: ABC transporter substrate-binding protein [unclassified Chromobacterium]|nr:transporter substrate-binding domain-containing protein [Chromobacterium sp. LK1]
MLKSLSRAALALSLLPNAGAATLHFATQDFPPFIEVSDKPQPQGLMVDVLVSACQRLGWSCEIQPMVWRRALLLAEEGKVDGIFPVQDTPERRLSLALSAPVFNSSYGLFATASSNFRYQQPQDLALRRIAVYGPSITQNALDKLVAGLPNINITVENNQETVLKKLAALRYGADAVVFANEDVTRFLIRREALSGIRPLATIQPLTYLYGFPLKNVKPNTVADFNQALAAMCRDGTLPRLARRYNVRMAGCK